MKTLLTAALAIATLGAAPMYSGAPDVSLASSFISSGGGSGSFSTVRAFDRMIGSDATLAEERMLRNAVGSRDMDRFVREMDYAVADMWTVASRKNLKLPPAPSTAGDTTLAQSLVRAGIGPDGTFSTPYLFAHLAGADVETQVMQDVDTRFGPGSSQELAQMGDRFFTGVAQDVNVSLQPKSP